MKAWIIMFGVKLTMVCAVIGTALLSTGCSTVSGVGKDISSAAEWTKDKMGGK